MINELIKQLNKLGYNSIRLAVEVNHIPAIKLYEKCGFKKVGTHFMYEHHYYLYEFVF
jgi:ribosomal protein S18 acetylase RimI-like enzyme